MRISDWSSDVCSSDLLGRNRRARAGFPVLARIAEVRNDRGEALRRGAAQRVVDDEQLHQIVVRGEVRRLDDEDILAPDILVDFDEDFLVGEAAHASVGQRQFEIVRDRTGQRQVAVAGDEFHGVRGRSEEHTSELQSLMRISYAVFCLKKKNNETTKK